MKTAIVRTNRPPARPIEAVPRQSVEMLFPVDDDEYNVNENLHIATCISATRARDVDITIQIGRCVKVVFTGVTGTGADYRPAGLPKLLASVIRLQAEGPDNIRIGSPDTGIVIEHHAIPTLRAALVECARIATQEAMFNGT